MFWCMGICTVCLGLGVGGAHLAFRLGPAHTSHFCHVEFDLTN